MQLSVLSLLLPVIALASPVIQLEERAAKSLATQIMANLTQTRTDAIAENKTLNEFGDKAEPSFYQALALQSGGNAIEADLNATIKTINKSGPFTQAQSTAIYNQINTKLYPVTKQLLQNFIDHYPGLNEQGLSGSILTSLKEQKSLVQQQGTLLVNKSQGPAKTNGPALSKKIVALFTNAINVYSK